MLLVVAEFVVSNQAGKSVVLSTGGWKVGFVPGVELIVGLVIIGGG